MTRFSRDFGDTMKKEAVLAVSTNVRFASSRFSNYKIGANNQIMEAKDDPRVLSMKEVIARETAQLLEQQKRLSVRDLASKFEKGLAAAAKLSEEARLREAASLEKHVLLKKLRDALESLKGRVASRNKDDVEEAIAMVEALAVQLTQREGELILEKAEVKKLANFLKQASENAKKLVDEERTFARAEIDAARVAVQKVEDALQEHERISWASANQDYFDSVEEYLRIGPPLYFFIIEQEQICYNRATKNLVAINTNVVQRNCHYKSRIENICLHINKIDSEQKQRNAQTQRVLPVANKASLTLHHPVSETRCLRTDTLTLFSSSSIEMTKVFGGSKVSSKVNKVKWKIMHVGESKIQVLKNKCSDIGWIITFVFAFKAAYTPGPRFVQRCLLFNAYPRASFCAIMLALLCV
ncbi:hypothetical protein UlMin_014591 [Ulmus minor]